ncbi:MAG: CARDB domain-containing protein [Thermoanaerobaculia bacterium]
MAMLHQWVRPRRLVVSVAIVFTMILGGGVLLPTAVGDPASPFSISNVDSPDPIASGAELTYTITMVNTGGSKTTNVVMTDQLNGVGGIGVPPQLDITSTRGSCSQSANLVTCDAGTIEGGGTWVVTIRGIVTASDGTTINNTASVTGTRSAQNFTSTTTATTLVSNSGGSPLADLTIAKTGPTSVLTSSPMTYTLTVNNLGNANATNVKVVDTVPAGLTGISASGTSLFACSVSGQTVTCTGGAVNAGSNATITINATSPPVTGSITNTASVDPDNAISESNELNNTSALVDTSVVSTSVQPPLTINLTDDGAQLAGAGPDPVIPNALLTYKILVTNTSSLRADDVVIVNGTQGLQASSITGDQVVTNGTVGNFGGCVVTAPQVKCSVRTLNPGGTILMTVTGRVIASAGSTIIDTATVTSNIRNTGYSATDSELTTVKPGIDLTVTKADSPDPVCARSWPGNAPVPLVCRGGLTYTFVVGNSGINQATNVTLRDPLMAGLILDSWSAPAFAGGCSVDVDNVVTCTGGTIPPESTTTVTLTLVAPSVTGTITNTVHVDPANAIFEADETNNSATTSTQVITGIDLTVAKADAIDPIATSGTQTYTITVNNLGTQDASGIRVRDTLPSGTSFRDVISDHGFTCSHSSGVVECVGGAIKGTASNNYAPLGGALANPADTATITIRIFSQSFAGTMHNEVRVDPLGEIAEADETNNVAVQDTVVDSFGSGHGSFNQLTIAKTQTSPSPANTARNAVVTYSITVGNNGSDTAVGVVVRDFLPSGARYIEATGTNEFLCSQVGGYINCAGGQIPSMGSATITLKAYAPDVPGTYVNQAIVDPDNAIPEGNELDNQASAQTVVVNGGAGSFNDLAILKTATPDVSPGGTIHYDLQVSNHGSDPALNVSLRDALPAGVTFVSAADTGVGPGAAFTCSESGGVVTCTGATINAGGLAAARTVHIVATAPNAVTNLENEAVVDPANAIPEGDELNNTSTAPTSVTPAINLTISKTGPTTATQSQVTDYKITVKNNAVAGKKQIATGVVVTDPMPVGLIPLAATAGDGNNWTCTIFENPVNLVQCVGDLAGGGDTGDEVEITITVFVTAESGRVLDNVACVDPENQIAEPVEGELDNCSQVGTFVLPPPPDSPDIQISKQVDSMATTPGSTLTYTITVANVGTAAAQGWNGSSGLTVVDDLPSELTFVNFSTTNGWSCSEAAGTVTCHDDGTGMDPGESAQITILASVNTGAAIPIANTATASPAIYASCSGTCVNETPENLPNVSTVVSSIGSTGFDLAISNITDVPDPLGAGQGLKYTVVAVNGGTSTASNVLVRLTIPSSGVSFVSADGSNGFNCGAPSGTTIDCTGDLPGGGNTTLSVSFIALLSSLPPEVSLTATIDPLDVFAETDEGNNSDTETTTISASGACMSCIDLVAAQIVTPDPVYSGGSLAATFQVVNVGDMPTSLNPASDVLLSFYATTDSGLSASAPTTSLPGVVTCASSASGPNWVYVECKGNLAPAQGVTLTLPISSASGSYLYLYGTADPNGVVSETTETNNTLSRSLVLW